MSAGTMRIKELLAIEESPLFKSIPTLFHPYLMDEIAHLGYTHEKYSALGLDISNSPVALAAKLLIYAFDWDLTKHKFWQEVHHILRGVSIDDTDSQIRRLIDEFGIDVLKLRYRTAIETTTGNEI